MQTYGRLQQHVRRSFQWEPPLIKPETCTEDIVLKTYKQEHLWKYFNNYFNIWDAFNKFSLLKKKKQPHETHLDIPPEEGKDKQFKSFSLWLQAEKAEFYKKTGVKKSIQLVFYSCGCLLTCRATEVLTPVRESAGGEGMEHLLCVCVCVCVCVSALADLLLVLKASGFQINIFLFSFL